MNGTQIGWMAEDRQRSKGSIECGKWDEFNGRKEKFEDIEKY